MCSLWPTTQTLSRCSLLSKCMILWYTWTHKKSMVFPLLFTTLINAQWYYLYISHIKFHPNLTINAESTDRNSLMSLSEVWIALNQFSQNSKFLNGNIWRSRILNFTFIILQIYKVWVDIHCCLYVIDLIFMKLMLVWQLSVQKFYTEIREKVADTRPEMDDEWIHGWTDMSILISIFF